MDCTLGWPSMTMHCGQCFLKIILDAEWGRIMTEDKYTNFFLLRSADLPKTLIKLHLHDYPPPLWITTTTTNNISDPKFLSSRHWSVSNCPHNINNFLVRNSNLCWGPLAPQAFSCDDVLWDQPSVIVWQCDRVWYTNRGPSLHYLPQPRETESVTWDLVRWPWHWVQPGNISPDIDTTDSPDSPVSPADTVLQLPGHWPPWTGPTGLTYPRFGLIKVT